MLSKILMIEQQKNIIINQNNTDTDESHDRLGLYINTMKSIYF